MWAPRLDETHSKIKIAWKKVNNFRYADDTDLMEESEEELKSLLMKVKEESEKVGLRLNIQKINIMTSGPITSWQIDGETMETVTDLILGASKITADGDCRHEIKRRLLLGRKVMTSLDSILKSRDIVNKGPSSQGYGFSSSHFWMWELDCKKSWVQKNWCLWTEALEKTLESPLDCKVIIPRCSLEGLMLKLKLQYFGHLRRRADSLEKTLMLGKIEGRGRRGWQRMRWLDGITDTMDMGLGGLRVAKSPTWLSDWTEVNWREHFVKRWAQ